MDSRPSKSTHGVPYFVKRFDGETNPKGNYAENVRAVVYLAHESEDREEFDDLVEILGLHDTLNKMRTEKQRAS